MKALYRRFLGAFCAVIVIITATLVMPENLLGQGTIITVTPTFGPHVKTTQFVNDVSYALLNGLTSFGMYNAIASGSSVNISNAFSTANGGQAVYYTTKITSSTPFTLSQVVTSFSDINTIFSATFGQFGITYTKMGEGVGVDGTVYTSGNANTLVTAIYIVGLGRSFDTTGETLDEAINSWVAYCPFTTTGGYSINGISGQAQINFVDPAPAPEPSTIALCILGIGTLILSRQKSF